MENVNKIKELYEESSMTLEEIALAVGSRPWFVWDWVSRNYSDDYRKARKIKNYSRSKMGNKNPQYGLIGEKNDKYIGIVADGKGYLMVPKPDWYTGRKGSKHVFQHQIVMCEALGITEIPKGFCVHHVDEDKTNNKLVNLALMTTAAHMRLHQLAGATTRAQPVGSK